MGLSLVPSSKSRLLTCLIGNKALLSTQCIAIGPHLSARGSFIVFLELRREPGVHSRVTAGEAFNNFVFSAMTGLLSSSDGHLRSLN